MGQKTNPNIFRLGVSKTWKTAYYENTLKELPTYIYKDNNFLQFIDRYLSKSGFFVKNYNYHFNESTIIVYISYFVQPTFNIQDNTKLENSKLILNNKQNKKNLQKNNSQNKNKQFKMNNKKKLYKNKTLKI